MSNNKVFERLEKKYLLEPDQYDLLLDRLRNKTAEDDYGKYTICNLYLDTWDYSLIRASIDKPLYKEKIRLRSYGISNPDDNVFLEVKKKFKGVVYKRRISLPLWEADEYLLNGTIPNQPSQIFKEIDWAMKKYKPHPAVYIAYDRIALKGIEDNELRITFDTDMRWRTSDLDLTSDTWGIPIIEDERVLMEIKALGAMPLWLTKTLSDLEIYPRSFSKYGTCYNALLRNPVFERSYTCA